MTTVVLALHLIITIVLIFLILLQKTEGNAAGGGFGAGASLTSMMQPRSRPNASPPGTGPASIQRRPPYRAIGGVVCDPESDKNARRA